LGYVHFKSQSDLGVLCPKDFTLQTYWLNKSDGKRNTFFFPSLLSGARDILKERLWAQLK
jgi:hypothetical protein